jgi:branched-subunit amino acid aminotransferase/4-amino-4-deoxychorismate lyase
VSNAFLVKDDVLITPIARGEEEEVARLDEDDDDLEGGNLGGTGGGATNLGEVGRSRGAAMPSPVLPGVTRRWVMDWARGQRLDVERRMVKIDDVLGADEVLLTNSSWGVLPVVKVEKEAIGDGVVGPVGKALAGAWNDLLGAP